MHPVFDEPCVQCYVYLGTYTQTTLERNAINQEEAIDMDSPDLKGICGVCLHNGVLQDLHLSVNRSPFPHCQSSSVIQIVVVGGLQRKVWQCQREYVRTHTTG